MKQTITEALTDLAEMEKANREFYKNFEAETGIYVYQTNSGNSCHISGIAHRDIETTKRGRFNADGEPRDYPTEYSVVVNGIHFIEITDEPWEGER